MEGVRGRSRLGVVRGLLRDEFAENQQRTREEMEGGEAFGLIDLVLVLREDGRLVDRLGQELQSDGVDAFRQASADDAHVDRVQRFAEAGGWEVGDG